MVFQDDTRNTATDYIKLTDGEFAEICNLQFNTATIPMILAQKCVVTFTVN